MSNRTYFQAKNMISKTTTLAFLESSCQWATFIAKIPISKVPMVKISMSESSSMHEFRISMHNFLFLIRVRQTDIEWASKR